MTRKMLASALVVTFGFVAMAASACPPGSKKTADKGATPPCHAKKAATVADKDATPPCHGKKAVTVAGKTDDGRSEGTAKTVSTGAKKPCCGSKKAATVAVKNDKPCCKKGAKAVAKGADKPCCKKGAKTVASKRSDKPCCKKGKTTASADGGCPIAKKVSAVLAAMPSLKYRVGEEVTGCSKSAATMAEASHKPVEFVVGDDVLTDEGKAMVRLTALLEDEAESLQTIQYVANGKCMKCPMTAKRVANEAKSKVAYRVGGVDLPSKETAEKVLASIKEAVSEVAIAYKVDGKSYGCSKMAGEKCKKSGKKMTFVVAGEETPCETTAKLKLAEARVKKIVETAVSTSFSL